MKHRDSLFRDNLFLIATLAILFGPFVIHAGFLRDDLGLLAYPPRTTTYREYQALMSSQSTMTGRPVSALLHGVCGWTFGTTAWPYHLVNLTLFGTTVLLVFHALTRILPRRRSSREDSSMLSAGGRKSPASTRCESPSSRSRTSRRSPSPRC